MTQELSKSNEAPLCKCGCGRYVTRNQHYPYDWNKYITGHNWKGKHHTAKSLRKIGKANLGRKRSAKWKPLKSKTPLCKCGCGNPVTRSKLSPYGWNKYINGHQALTGFLGKHHTAESKAKMSKARKGVKFTKEHREKISEALMGRKFSAESRSKMSEAQIGKKASTKTRRKMSESRRGKNNSKWSNPSELTSEYLQAIRCRDNFTCQFCGCKNKSKHRKLDTHHIDDNRHNNYPDNIITLCQLCHQDTTRIGDKEAWRRVYTNLMKKIKRQNPEGHRAAIRIYEQNIKIYYGKG